MLADRNQAAVQFVGIVLAEYSEGLTSQRRLADPELAEGAARQKLQSKLGLSDAAIAGHHRDVAVRDEAIHNPPTFGDHQALPICRLEDLEIIGARLCRGAPLREALTDVEKRVGIATLVEPVNDVALRR